MKKILAMFLAMTMCIYVAGCGESNSSEQTPAQAPVTEITEVEEEQSITTTTTMEQMIPAGSPIDYVSFNWDYCSQSGGKTYANITVTNNSSATIYGSVKVDFDNEKTVIVNLPIEGVQPGKQKIKTEVNDDIPGGYNDVSFYDNSLSFYKENSATTTTTTTTTTIPKKTISDVFEYEPVLYLLWPNSAGGLQYWCFTKYIGSKQIKYYTIFYEMFNSVGDPAYDDIKGLSVFSTKTSGPVDPGNYIVDISDDRPVVYCWNCDRLQINTIELEYMDGTKDTIDVGWSYGMQTDSSLGFTNIVNSIRSDYPDYYNYISNR